MIDKQLIRTFGPIITSAYALLGLDPSSAQLVPRWQPTQQGVSSAPIVTFLKVSDRAYGFPSATYTTELSGVVETTTQWRESVWQFGGYFLQDPLQPNSPTASDVINQLVLLFQSQTQINVLLAQGVSVLRVSAIHNLPWLDDQNKGEFIPSFDLTFTHQRTITQASAFIDGVVSGIYPI